METEAQQERPGTALLICTNNDKIQRFSDLVEPMGIRLVVARSERQAVDLRRSEDIAIILLNIVQQPAGGFDGPEVIKVIRKDHEARFTPIICIADFNLEQTDLTRCYEAGCVDVLYSPLDPVILGAKIRLHLDLYQRQQELELATEIIHKQNQLLQERAIRDGLTGLYNHLYFHELLSRQFSHAQRHKNSLCLLLFDLDYFKEVNDTYGHQVGDRVLAGFAKLVADEVRESDILARYGGEEFALVLPDTDIIGGRLAAEKIRERAAHQVYSHKDTTITVTVSVGVCQLNDDMAHPSELIDRADDALYQAKAMGRNRTVCIQTDGKDVAPCDQLSLEGFQPIRERLRATIEKTRSRAMASFEAMVHAQTKDYQALRERNKLALRMVNLMGRRLHLPNSVLQSFRRAFKLHDLLRIFISDSALGKAGSLTDHELTVIRDQPLMLKELTALFDFFADERALLQAHHEHFDGSGYPEGISGGEIPMGARLFSLVDAFVAMANPSYKRPALSRQEIVEELQGKAGRQFDPFLVEVMAEVLEQNSCCLDESLDSTEGGV